MKIWCSDCERKIIVKGQIWNFRLSRSERDPEHPDCYKGWRCDACADAVESGGGY